jgi:hypothetical protein
LERLEGLLRDGFFDFFLIDGAILIIIKSAEAEIFIIDSEHLKKCGE